MHVGCREVLVNREGKMHGTMDSPATITYGFSSASINGSNSVQFAHSEGDISAQVMNQADQTCKISSPKFTCTVFSKIICASINLLVTLVKILCTFVYIVVLVAIEIALVIPVTMLCVLTSCFLKCFCRNQNNLLSVVDNITELTKFLAFCLTVFGILSPVFGPIFILNYCGIDRNINLFFKPIYDKFEFFLYE